MVLESFSDLYLEKAELAVVDRSILFSTSRAAFRDAVSAPVPSNSPSLIPRLSLFATALKSFGLVESLRFPLKDLEFIK